MRKTVLYVCVGLLLTGWGTARAVSPTQLAGELRTILQNASSEQNQLLLKWKQQWEQAGYVKDSVYVKALLQIGMLRYLDNQYPDAAAVVEQAVQVCRTNRTGTRPADLSKALYRLGVVGIAQNLTDKAIAVLKQAIVAGRNDAESAMWVSNAHLYLAYCYDTKSDYQQMITQADMGLQTSARLDSKPLTANLLRQKAQALTSLQRYAKARQTIEQAIQLIQYKKELTEALSDNYSLLSVILGHQDQPDQALTYARQAFDLAKQINSYHKTDCAIRVSFLLNQAGQYSQARKYSNYVIVHGTDHFKRAWAFQLTGVSYWKQKKYGQALQSYQRGMTELPIGFSVKKIEQLPSDEQIRLIAQKEVLFTLLRDKASTWLDSAKAVNNPRCLRYALQTYEVADRLIDYMRWDHTADQSKLFWRGKTRGIYERAIQTCVLLNDTEQAFRFFEKSRAVLLADKLNELGARQQLPDEQAKKEKKLRQAVINGQNALAQLTPDSARYKSVRERLDNEQQLFEEFAKQLETSYPDYFRYKYDTITTKLADLQGYLRQRKSTFVSYFVGDSAVYVLGVEPDRARLLKLNQSVPMYKRNVRAFINLLSNPDAIRTNADHDRLLALGHSIYRQALAPLSPPAGCVIVSPDRFFVPFEALSASANKADYLVQTHAFDYAYSARLLLRGGRSAPTAGFWEDGFLGFAPVTFAPKLGQVSLPGSDESLTAIGERFRRPKLFTHQAATRQAFETHAPHARIIQLFTHAVADTTDREPLLYFADDTLRLSELSNSEPFNTQLAVLGACQTGVGTDQVGEGVFSLARGFASLGVPSIVSTLWSVQDQATYDLTESFHQHLDEGMTKDVALQQAKQDWLRTHEGVDLSPSVWAGLILIGDTEPLSRPVQWAWVVGGALALLGAGGGALWWWRRRRNRTLVPNTVRLTQSGTHSRAV